MLISNSLQHYSLSVAISAVLHLALCICLSILLCRFSLGRRRRRWKLQGGEGQTQKGDKERRVILTLSFCQPRWEGDAGWRVTRRKEARHVRRANAGLPLSWHGDFWKRQRQLYVYMHVWEKGWNGSMADNIGGTPKLNVAGCTTTQQPP